MILVIGDVMIDEYIHGTVERISPEAPVPILREGMSEARPGGAANVAANIAAMGKDVYLCGVVGGDCPFGVFNLKGVKGALSVDTGRPTTIKRRLICNGQQMLRVDRESRFPVHPSTRKELFKNILEASAEADIIVVSDYNKGVVTKGLMEGLNDLSVRKKAPIIVDPKRSDFSFYGAADIITPNHDEWRHSHTHSDDVYHLITMGAQGIEVRKGIELITHIPTSAQEVIDVTGAGDTVVAAIACFLSMHPSSWLHLLAEAAEFANRAAAIAVSKPGTAVVSRNDLLKKKFDDDWRKADGDR